MDSTTALYHFCDTNTSSFAFDEYLFGLHAKLLAKFERDIEQETLPPEEKEERLNNARSNIFACEKVENIAIMVVENFAAELEGKLREDGHDFAEDLHLPFTWEIDEQMMAIVIKNEDGSQRDRIKLLDVKQRK